MNTAERFDVRQNIVTLGFKRANATPDIDAKGNYVETWNHPDGTIVTIEWAPKDPDTTSQMGCDDENAAEHAEAVRDRGITSAPGMYDEPDHGLSFGLLPSDSQDRIG